MNCKRLAWLFAILFCFSGITYADDAENVRTFIDGFLTRTFTTVNKGKIDASVIKVMEEEISHGVDYQWVGTFVMGNVFSMATEEQKTALVASYRKYLVYSYMPLIIRYKQVTYNVRTTSNVGNNTYIASVDIDCKNCTNGTINIIYRIRYRDGNYYIYDIVVEGNSFLASQRATFRNVTSRSSSVDDIMAYMQRENARLQRALPASGRSSSKAN